MSREDGGDSTAHWPEVRSAIRPDPAIESAVGELLRRMSLAQKVGQMIQAEIKAITPAEVREFHVGSVLNGGGSWPGENKRATAADWVALADAYYDASMDSAGPEAGVHLPIPVLWGTDAVHGHSNVMGATLFPHNIGLGAAGDPDLIERIGAITAREVAATGLDWTFAPTLAAVRDDRWGRTYEGYSEDPEVVRAYGGRMVQGLQGHAGRPHCLGPERVLATAKHFLADGGTLHGLDQGDTALGEQALIDLHAQGYLTALGAGAQTVMASFSSWNGVKMHGNPYLLTEVLRGPLGFDGLVVGDWNGHAQVPGCANDQAAAAINAGIDLLMVPFDWKAMIANTLEQVREGVIPVGRIDEAVTRILRVKMRAGLLGPGKNRDRPSTRPLAGDGSVLGAPAHRAVAREAVRKSLVLLKNKGGVLPLRPSSRVLVCGKGAHDIGLQSGGWTLTWQGTENQRDDFPNAQSIFEGIAEAVGAAGGAASLSPGAEAATPEYDAIIAVIGETPYAEGQGDIPESATLEHARRHPEDLALLDRLRAQAPGVPVVTVLLTGRPLYVNPELNRSDGFVVGWLPGGEGGGVADVLFGRAEFTGRLTFSWPGEPHHCTLNRGDGQRALFPYGYGLDAHTADPLLDALPEAGTREVANPGELELFTRGANRSGYALRVSDPSAAHGVDVGTAASSPARAVEVSTVDGRLQGSAKRVSWTGPAMLFCETASGASVDLSHHRGGDPELVLRLRLHAQPTTELWLGASGPGGLVELPLLDRLKQLPVGSWEEVRVPLERLVHAGLDLRSVVRPLTLRAAAGLVLDLEDLRWE